MSAVRPVAVIALSAALCGTAMSQELDRFTSATGLVEEFTATWCVPCYSAYFSLERARQRWGEQVSILTYSIGDELDNSYNSRRATEEGIAFIPSFVFQGDRLFIGTPSDAAMDQYITEAITAPDSARIIGTFSVDEANDLLYVDFKIEGYNDTLTTADQIRIVVSEDNWAWNCSNGLDQYNGHVQAGFDINLSAPIGPGQQVTFNRVYDLSTNPYLRNWDEVRVTMFVYDTSLRKAQACWELGKVYLGDLNGDLSINQQDVALFRRAYGKSFGHPDYNQAADFDRNGVINGTDRFYAEDYYRSGGMR